MFIKAGIKSIIIFNSTRGGEYGRVKFIIKGFTELAASELFIVISLEFERHRFTEVSSIYPSIYFKHTAAGSCSPKAETSATAGGFGGRGMGPLGPALALAVVDSLLSTFTLPGGGAGAGAGVAGTCGEEEEIAVAC